MLDNDSKTKPLPKPVYMDSRTCFGISYFLTEADADLYSAQVKERGDTFNGGFYHGMGCGRAAGYDRSITTEALNHFGLVTVPPEGDGEGLVNLYAVTTA